MMNGITRADKDLVLEFIVIDLFIQVLEKDIKALEGSKLKIKEPYINLVEDTIKRALRDRKNVKDRMRKNGVKVFPPTDVNEDFVEYKYLVRGYESVMRMFRYALRNYTRDKMNQYFLKEGENKHE